MCLYAASQYDEVIGDCQAWEKQFSGNPQLGEVLALLGDAYAASNREAAAIPIYIRSYQTAATDEVMNYSLTAASKLLQKQGEWDKLAELYTGFVKDKPDNPTVISALFWIGKAKAHEGKIDEAKKLAADTIKKYIDDRNREAVEQLITQLAQLCVKKKRPAETAEGASPAPAVAEEDPGAELERLLGTSGILPPQKRALFSRKPSWPDCAGKRPRKRNISRRSRVIISRRRSVRCFSERWAITCSGTAWSIMRPIIISSCWRISRRAR